MANNIIKRTWKQGGMVNIEDLRGSAFQAEDGGHTFLISGVDENGDALALSGTPAGVLLRADGQDVTLTCSVSDGVVSATLPANAYVVPGRVGITIFLTSDGQKTAIYAAVGSVATTSSGTVAPPAGADVVTLVNAIATAVATIPASYTDLMAAVAPTYSTSALYAVGSYAWYSGKLYRCTTAITSGETWTSAHWTQANLGSDVSDLKSALDANVDYINTIDRRLIDLGKETTKTTNIEFFGETLVKANTSVLASTPVVNVDIKQGEVFYIYANDVNNVITGTINVYRDNGSSQSSIGTVGENTWKAFTAGYDIKTISLYISGSGISGSGKLTLTIYKTVENTNSIGTAFDVNTYKGIQSEPSLNLFNGWKYGELSNNTGKYLQYTTNHIINNAPIPVTGGKTYSIVDPDAISANARNTQYVLEYNSAGEFLRSTTITSTDSITLQSSTAFIRLMSQTVGTNSYVVGNFNNFKTSVYIGENYAPYVSPKSVAKIKDDYPIASGVSPENLFHGGSYVCGGYNYSTGVVNKGSDVLITPFIPIYGTLYWNVFGGKIGDVQFVAQYDTYKAFISSTAVSGITGSLALNSNTRYIRIRTQTHGANSYAMPTADWYDSHLVVSTKLITRYVSPYPVISQKDVYSNFFDSAISFVGIDSYVSDIDSYAETIQHGAYDVVISIITDVHSVNPTPYSIHNYLASKGIADVSFNLGDNIPNYYTTKAEAMNVLEKIVFHEEYLKPRKNEIYVLCGNHDYNPYNNNNVDYTINQKLYYSLSQARTKKGYAGVGKNYGFLDIKSAKVRLIWLDSGDIFDNATGEPLTTGMNTIVQQEQFTWFCNVALNFMNKDDRSEWSVVTLSHDLLSSLSNGGFATVIKAFMDGTSASGTAYCVGRSEEPIPQRYDVDFSEQGGMEYICHLCGHYHEDNVVALGSTERDQICIACDNLTAYYYDGGTRTAYTRTAGTIEEHCIDTFCLDKANRKIYMKRLGVGSDRSLDY